MTDLAFVTLAEAGRLIRRKKLSPVEYTKALLARIERLDPRINAFLRLVPKTALAEARAAEGEIARGGWRGPLHGIPYGLKDIIDRKGLPTTAHSKILAESRARADATVAHKLRLAGGVFMGKTATHEFAIGGPCFDLPWPPARNPWNRNHHPGGSSSGSGAALAAGLLPAALGTDTGGSVRNPASMCALVGMKPTYGRVSRAGVIPLSFTLDHVGPMTRTVEDNAILLGVIAGHDPADPTSVRRPVADFAARIGKGVKGLRIGVIRHFYTRDMIADPEMGKAIEDALALLKGLGARIREVTLSPLGLYTSCNRVILASEGFAVHERWLKERPGDYASMTRRRLLPGAFLRASDYVQATRLRARLVHEFEAAMKDLDVLVTASSMEPPCRIDDPKAIEVTYPRQARAPFNVLGCPALTLPTGFSKAGLPLSMQIVGRAFDEATVYRVAHAYERATPWKTTHPGLD
ncbi:MAG: Asp-tRNA(Asn)/Glu-tRNA(Gln) amidotransferase subunit GatA [Proteobacteria bacterium]|nr:Asp-tRNA(Asn)/Glu-tRNA(Gln) amidotransferase subunit GatA [Pseudomonadota bacterium]